MKLNLNRALDSTVYENHSNRMNKNKIDLWMFVTVIYNSGIMKSLSTWLNRPLPIKLPNET